MVTGRFISIVVAVLLATVAGVTTLFVVLINSGTIYSSELPTFMPTKLPSSMPTSMYSSFITRSELRSAVKTYCADPSYFANTSEFTKYG